jgi:hypothetical protein
MLRTLEEGSLVQSPVATKLTQRKQTYEVSIFHCIAESASNVPQVIWTFIEAKKNTDANTQIAVVALLVNQICVGTRQFINRTALHLTVPSRNARSLLQGAIRCRHTKSNAIMMLIRSWIRFKSNARPMVWRKKLPNAPGCKRTFGPAPPPPAHYVYRVLCFTHSVPYGFSCFSRLSSS